MCCLEGNAIGDSVGEKQLADQAKGAGSGKSAHTGTATPAEEDDVAKVL